MPQVSDHDPTRNRLVTGGARETLTASRLIRLYGLCLAVVLLLDFIWLSLAGPTIYAREIGPLLREDPNLIAAAGFYALFAAGLTGFVLRPAIAARGPLLGTALSGAGFGLVAYATFDLTALAVLKGFTLTIALIDMAWGMSVGALGAGITLALARRLRM